MSSLFAAARQSLLQGALVWANIPVYATLVGATYVPDFENDTTVGNVTAGAILSPSVALTALSADDGYAEAAGVSFGVLTTTAPITAILLTLQLGDAQDPSDDLLLYLDQGIGFGFAAIGVPTAIIWNNLGIWRP